MTSQRSLPRFVLPTLFALAGGAMTPSLVSAQAPATGGAVKAKVRLAKATNPLVDLLAPYANTGSAMAKGDLYLQLCDDEACTKVVSSTKVINYMFSTGFPKEVQVGGLKPGTYHARFGLDTAKSQGLAGDFATQKGFGQLDVLQVASPEAKLPKGQNPPPATKKITIGATGAVDMGEVVLGSLVFQSPAFAPTTEQGFLLSATSGSGSYRNRVSVLDLSTYKLATPMVPKLGGKDFTGDLCGFVKGTGSTAYALGVGEKGAYVFAFDTDKRAFASGEPVWVPHPDCKADGTCGTLSPNGYPWLCRGTYAERGGKKMLYLVDYKGAGALPVPMGRHMAAIDVTKLDAGGGGSVVASYGVGAAPFLTNKRLTRAVAYAADKLYVLEPSWSKALVDDKVPLKNTIHVLPLLADGKVDFAKKTSFQVGTADDTCGATNNAMPAFGLYNFGGAPRLFVGTDNALELVNLDGKSAGSIDTTTYGVLPTSLALSPDGKTLYAMPNCKSSKNKARLLKGTSTTDRFTLDRHAVVILDLTSGGATPALKETSRDFDEDGTPDGGIDLEFLYLKRDLLRWAPDAGGSVPPTVYTGPEIAVGNGSLFMRGSGIQGNGGSSISSSGLGQVGDVGVYDLGKGRGVMFRNYNIWLDGPSSRWGYDLEPKTTSKDPGDDISVAALLYVPKKLDTPSRPGPPAHRPPRESWRGAGVPLPPVPRRRRIRRPPPHRAALASIIVEFTRAVRRCPPRGEPLAEQPRPRRRHDGSDTILRVEPAMTSAKN